MIVRTQSKLNDTEKSICGEFHQGENTTKNTTGCGDQAAVKFTSSCGGFYYKVVVELWWSCGGVVVKMWCRCGDFQ